MAQKRLPAAYLPAPTVGVRGATLVALSGLPQEAPMPEEMAPEDTTFNGLAEIATSGTRHQGAGVLAPNRRLIRLTLAPK